MTSSTQRVETLRTKQIRCYLPRGQSLWYSWYSIESNGIHIANSEHFMCEFSLFLQYKRKKFESLELYPWILHYIRSRSQLAVIQLVRWKWENTSEMQQKKKFTWNSLNVLWILWIENKKKKKKLIIRLILVNAKFLLLFSMTLGIFHNN